LIEATECFFGVNVDPTVDQCSYVWFIYIWALVFNVASNVLSLTVLKYASASTSVIVTAAVLPTSAVLYLWPFLAGLATVKTISVETIVSIPMVMLGIVVYRLVAERSTKMKTPSLIAKPSSELSIQTPIQEETDPLLDHTPYQIL